MATLFVFFQTFSVVFHFKMLNTEFTINLTEPIKPGKVTVGYFDGIHPSIVAVTRTDKVSLSVCLLVRFP